MLDSTDRLKQVFDAIGRGMRLRVPHDGSAPEIVDGYQKYGRNLPSIPVDKETAQLAIDSGMLHKFTEENVVQRIGWREAGYDGDVADWYAMVQ